MAILVAGASGFVGRRLCPELDRSGHLVRAMTRRPQCYTGAGTAVPGDVHDPVSLRNAMTGCDTAYYLVHSLDDPQFEHRDAEAARRFGQAAADAGLRRIVYLGGLGDDRDELSPHLRSRRAIEQLLGAADVPVTTLRAGVIVGHGGISWEMTRQLVENLPAMLTPKWVRTRTQPIALDDVVRYLAGVLDHTETIGRTFDIGGSEALTYGDMLHRLAAIEGRPLLVVPVPLLSPRISALWLTLVTDIAPRTGRSLVESMVNETTVRDHAIRDIIDFEPMDYDEAVLRALGERAKARRAA